MYNDASADKTAHRCASRESIKKGKGANNKQECREEPHHDDEGYDNNADENLDGPPRSAILQQQDQSTAGRFALEVEELIQAEQASRVVLLKQLTSLRDQVWCV